MSEGANAEMIEYWNHVRGSEWVTHHASLDAMLAEIGARTRSVLDPQPGESILDVGSGCGAETLRLAEAVGPTGRALGVDISAPMLAAAREMAEAGGLSKATFVQADGQTHAFEHAAFDAVYSRFGVMFFDDPVGAFANIRRALKPSGRLTFVCWGPLSENPWMFEPLAAVAQYVELPPPPVPGAPGPFAFADEVRTCRILSDAGFGRVEARSEEIDLLIGGGGTTREAAEFLVNFGPGASALREAGPDVPDFVPVLTEALRKHETTRGVVLPGKAWIVTATNG